MPNENRWATTRFEEWWNSKFNSLLYREPFTFIPYKIKLGTYNYGGNDYWEQIFSEGSTDLSNSPFITDNNDEFNYVNDLKYREGIALEIDFLGYNFFKKLENSVDIIFSLGYKLNKPLLKSEYINDWINDNEVYRYYPVMHTLKLNSTFILHRSEKYFSYFNYSFGKVDASLFKDSQGDRVIKGEGTSTSMDIGFNIIKKLKNKKFNLLYGFEIGLNELKLDDIDIDSRITSINSQDAGIKFTIGVAYGGNRTIGDQGFSYLINSDYIDAIDSFNKFKIQHPNHPKVKLANTMIEFSREQIAYDMLYNGIDSYNNKKIEDAIDWFNQGLSHAKDSTLIYEIKSRQYIIATELFQDFDVYTEQFTLDESINYINYIESISSNINKDIKSKKVDLLYAKGDYYLSIGDYENANKKYSENNLLYPDYFYIYKGKINIFLSFLIEEANTLLLKKDYINAYETMKFINSLYPNINDYIENNIALLKLELDTQNANRINNHILDIINNAKKEFQTLDQSTVIQIGDSFNKIVNSIGEPIETKSRRINKDTYQMSTYLINNINYRLFFENNILFDIEKYD